MEATSTLYVYPSGYNQGSEPQYRVENPHDKSRRPRNNNNRHHHQENYHRYQRNSISKHHRNKPRHPRHHPDSLDPYNHYQSPPQTHGHSQDISPSAHSQRYDRHNLHSYHQHQHHNYTQIPDNYNRTPNIPSSPSPSIASSDSTAPQLYFPLNEVESIASSTSTPTIKFNDTPQPSASSVTLDNDADQVSTPDPAAATLAKLGSMPPPPLSALKASDGKIMLSVEDMERMSKLPISDIQQILNEQRLKNEELLAKLHNDQKNFVKVLKHYEKKNRRLEKQIIEYETNNAKTVKSVMLMTQLLTEYKTETENNEREDILYERVKGELHKGVNLNTQLLLEVDLLTKNVDSYHAMIAKSSRKLNASKIHYDTFVQKEKEQDKGLLGDNKAVDDEKKEMEQEEEDDLMIQKEDNEVKDDGDFVGDKDDIKSPGSVRELTETEMKLEEMIIGGGLSGDVGGSDPMKKYADQLVIKNKKYKEVLAILRCKVDELRSYRKKL